MTEEFMNGAEKIADSLTEAQSHIVAYENEIADYVTFRYTDKGRTIEIFLTTNFLKFRYTIIRNYLDNCIRYFLARA